MTAPPPTLFPPRPSWSTAPAPLRRRVEDVTAAPVLAFSDVPGGMSPGPAAILHLHDGRRVFVKAVSKAAAPGSHRAYAREAATLAVMPRPAPAPRLLGRAEADDWLALVMSAAPGRPAGPPWTPAGAALVTAACEQLASVGPPTGHSVPRAIDRCCFPSPKVFDAAKDGDRAARTTARSTGAMSVRLTLSAVAAPASSPASPIATQNTPEAAPTLQTVSDEKSTSRPYLIGAGILIAAGLGTLALMLTRRRRVHGEAGRLPSAPHGPDRPMS